MAWLKEKNISFELIDIVQNPPTEEMIKQAIIFYGDRKKILNTSGMSYRAIGSSVVKKMDDDQFIQALLQDGKLIKRPFLVAGNGDILVGFKKISWENSFLS